METTLEKEENLMQVIHGTERPEFLLESEGDVQKAINKLIERGESIAVFFHANNRSIIGRVMADDVSGISLMKRRISSRLRHKNDPLRVRAGECLT